VFVISQLVLMGIGMLPMKLWRSQFKRAPVPSEPKVQTTPS